MEFDHQLHAPSVLKIDLFGCPKVIRPADDVPTRLGLKAGELLALLLLRGHHTHRREKLANLLWPESPPDSAAHSFRTTLWRLRQALEPPGVTRGTYLHNVRAGEIGFNWESEYSVDVLEFQSTLSQCNEKNLAVATDTDLETIERALRLYEGELLEGHCDDWIVYERERMRELFIRGHRYMLRELTKKQEYQQAIACGRRILAEDPLHEAVHRELMPLYARVGQRAEAIKLYEQLNRTLEQELEVAPARETTQAYVQILQLERRTRKAPRAVDRELRDAASELRSSLDAVAHEFSRMSATLEGIERLLSPPEPPSD